MNEIFGREFRRAGAAARGATKRLRKICFVTHRRVALLKYTKLPEKIQNRILTLFYYACKKVSHHKYITTFRG